jgi:hypothetical protein
VILKDLANLAAAKEDLIWKVQEKFGPGNYWRKCWCNLLHSSRLVAEQFFHKWSSWMLRICMQACKLSSECVAEESFCSLSLS